MASGNCRNAAFLDDVQLLLVANPNGAVFQGENRADHTPSQSLAGREGENWCVSKKIDSLIGCDPKVAFSIFVNEIYVVTGETVRDAVMVGNPIMNAVQAVGFGSNP